MKPLPTPLPYVPDYSIAALQAIFPDMCEQRAIAFAEQCKRWDEQESERNRD